MKKNFQLFIFILSLLIFSSNANAEVFTFDNKLLINYVNSYKQLPDITVDKDKEFSIKFNKEVDLSTINNNTVKVINNKGEEIDITVNSEPSNKKLGIVMPPSEGYSEGETYALIVTNGITDLDGKKLNKEIVIMFTVRENEEEKFSWKAFDAKYTETSTNPTRGFIGIIPEKSEDIPYYWTQNRTTEKWGLATPQTKYNPQINEMSVKLFEAIYKPEQYHRTLLDYNVYDEFGTVTAKLLYSDKEEFKEYTKPVYRFDLYDAQPDYLEKNLICILLVDVKNKTVFNKNLNLLEKAVGVFVGDNNSKDATNFISKNYNDFIDNKIKSNVTGIKITKQYGEYTVLCELYTSNSGEKYFYTTFIKK